MTCGMYWPFARPFASSVACFCDLLRRFVRLGGFRQIIFPVLVITLPKLVLFFLRQFAPRGAQLLVEHAHRLAGKTRVLAQVKIAARGDAFQLVASHVAVRVLFAERELEQNVRAGAGVMRQFLRRLMMKTERLARKPDAFVKPHALLDPVLVPRFPAPVRLRVAELRIADCSGK